MSNIAKLRKPSCRIWVGGSDTYEKEITIVQGEMTET
jgi:hypothetical protein